MSCPQEKNLPGEGGGSRSGKLARRARSFKEDFLDILSQMRSPGGGGSGGGSPRPPRSPKARTSSSSDTQPDDRNPVSDLQVHVKQVQFALKHFQDVVSRNKLEVLAGNGTIVLESVATIHSVLNSYVFIDQSVTLVSATKQVYQSLAGLIKLCDDVLLGGEKAIDRHNVELLLKEVGDAVQNLVELARVKMNEKNCGGSSGVAAVTGSPWSGSVTSSLTSNNRDSQSSGGRSSLPDIPLTPRERLILEQTSAHSQTQEYISPEQPPPKPPLPPMRVWVGESPPPLPPKKKGGAGGNTLEHLTQASERMLSCERTSNAGERLSLGSERHSGSERLSIRSDESSLGSSDSMLNASSNLDPDDLKASGDDFAVHSLPNQAATNHGSSSLLNGSQGGWDSSCSNVSERTQSPELPPPSLTGGGEWGTSSLTSSGFTSMRSYSYSSSSKSSSVSVCLEQQHQAATTRSSTVQQSASVQQSSSLQQSTSVQQSNIQQSFSKSVEQSVSSTSFQQSVSSASVQQTNSHQQITSSTMSGSSAGIDVRDAVIISDESVERPPALPAKKRSLREREPSTYDNVPLTTLLSSSPPSSKPPPLPMKKKHIMAYMEMFGNCSHSNTSDFLRHSMHSYSMMQAEWQQHQASISSAQSCSFAHHQTNSFVREEVRVPPALPPKRSRPHVVPPPSTPPASPVNHLDLAKLELEGPVTCPIVVNGSVTTPLKNSTSSNSTTAVLAVSPMSCGVSSLGTTVSPLGSSLSPSAGSGISPLGSAVSPLGSIASPLGSTGISPLGSTVSAVSSGLSPLELASPSGIVTSPSTLLPPEEPVLPSSGNPLFEFDVSHYLVMKKPEEEGPDIRGGHPDALVVLATKASKNDFLYQEAFLTTYRTFLSPLELIGKLCSRHQRFSSSTDLSRQRAAREAFSLLVRVVSDLTMSDLEDCVMQTLMDFVYQLLYKGELTMAKALRVKILEKYCARQQSLLSNSPLSSSHSITIRQSTLLDFKSDQVAEQMTLLDSELFMKIEIPEVLIWAQEQNEERSPNLTCFTEHFNKMSYWARSRILEKDDGRERERYVVKFIKVMKHLRKINNFNSYLALLSALDSAPIRRLEWQKHITEGLKEYCALIDSSSSFRAYRQALAETNPPCIPYIGLVLQDLTFVHIGNSDFLSDAVINFSKRWQQFNIVENMKRFKKGTYSYKKNERIISFFNNFDNHLCEEAMWQMSEKIKPRGSKKPAAAQ